MAVFSVKSLKIQLSSLAPPLMLPWGKKFSTSGSAISSVKGWAHEERHSVSSKVGQEQRRGGLKGQQSPTHNWALVHSTHLSAL